MAAVLDVSPIRVIIVLLLMFFYIRQTTHMHTRGDPAAREENAEGQAQGEEHADADEDEEVEGRRPREHR